MPIVPFVIALSFAAGLNLYATVATLGLLGRAHMVTLPSGLEPLADTWVIAAAVVLFGCGFFADKIPIVDLVWNVAHTFIRIPVAALLAWRASSHLTPGMQALVVVASAAIAAASHGAKTATRTLVTASPEPVSNITLSAGEDVVSIALTWAATRHPVAASVVTVVMLVGIGILFRRVWLGLRGGWKRLLEGPGSEKPQVTR